MEDIRLLSLVICLLVLLYGALPVCAAEVTETATVPTQTQTEDYLNSGTDASVYSGCHTIDAQVPLLGSSKLLETAGAAMLFEVNSDTVMYAWNPDMQMYPASLVKIMTAMLAIENGNLSDVVTVSANALAALPENSSTLDLQAGETVTLEQLLYCLLVGSSNDAAVVIADHIAGSQQGFLHMMNQRAEELGCTGTVFVNTHGLHDDTQVTTARDMVRILREAIKSEQFTTIFGTTAYSLPATNLSEERYMETQNYMMMPKKVAYYDGRVTGGRTGVTTDRERTLIVTAEKNGLLYIAVVLSAVPTFETDGYTPIRFGSYEETKELLAMGFDGYSTTQILCEGQILGQYPVTNGKNSIAVGPATSVATVLPSGITYDALSVRYDQAMMHLDAPVEKGETVSSVQIWYGNVCVAQAPVITMNSAGIHEASGTNGNTGNGDGGALETTLTVVGIAAGILLCCAAALYITRFVRAYAANAQHRRRRRNRRRSK